MEHFGPSSFARGALRLGSAAVADHRGRAVIAQGGNQTVIANGDNVHKP
jgi:hypothetical protein